MIEIDNVAFTLAVMRYSKTDDENGCWIEQIRKYDENTDIAWAKAGGARDNWKARVPVQRLFKVLTEEVPADKPYILHTCGNKRCCNPDHMVYTSDKFEATLLEQAEYNAGADASYVKLGKWTNKDMKIIRFLDTFSKRPEVRTADFWASNYEEGSMKYFSRHIDKALLYMSEQEAARRAEFIRKSLETVSFTYADEEELEEDNPSKLQGCLFKELAKALDGYEGHAPNIVTFGDETVEEAVERMNRRSSAAPSQLQVVFG